ncbi:MAG: hypothetical protein IJW40_07890, partial [Clostridia bacterium]|nr:hypothetical protein [Clostridia bacterium]
GAGLFAIDTKPVARNNRIYLPIRAVAETFGYTVDYDYDTDTVVIESDGTYMASVTGDNSIHIVAYPDWIGDISTYQ